MLDAPAMSTLLLKGHQGLSAAALLCTVTWVVIVVAAPKRPVGLGRLGRYVYVCALGSAALAALSGVLLLPSGPGLVGASPWLGLGAIMFHLAAGVRARKALRRGRKTSAVNAAALQLMFLVIGYVLMTVAYS